MAKYSFTKLPDEFNKHDISTVEVTFETESLEILLEEFANFLSASGFAIDKTKESIVLSKQEEYDDGFDDKELSGEQEELVVRHNYKIRDEAVEDDSDIPIEIG